MIDDLYSKSLEVESMSHNVTSKLHAILLLESSSKSDKDAFALQIIRKTLTDELHEEIRRKR